MNRRRNIAMTVILVVGTALPGALAVQPAQAQDFFSSFFRSFGGQRAPIRTPYAAMNYGSEPVVQFPPRSTGGYAGGSSGGGTAYCVRTCDGRYFPAPAAAGQSRAETCKSFCPAAETRVFYGRTIDNASTENGKDYADMPNAFKFREELVAGCTCNGTDPVGLAKVDINQDRTLRQGDFVAASDGLKVVSSRPDRRGAELNFSPAPRSVRARYEQNAALN